MLQEGLSGQRVSTEGLKLLDAFLRIGDSEYIGTCNEYISPYLGKQGSGLMVDATINLDEGMRTSVSNELAKLAHLLKRVRNELLTTKTRIYRHEEHHIHLRDNVFKHVDRGGGTEGDGGMESCLTNLLKDTMVMGERLEMDIHEVSAQLGHLGNELLGLNNHEVNIKGLLAKLGNPTQYGKTKGDVGNEDTIHDIEMEIVGRALIEPLHLAFEIAEIGRKK